MVWQFNMAHKDSAEVLPRVPNYKKAVMGLTGKICGLAQLASDMIYRAVGHDFSINESTAYIK